MERLHHFAAKEVGDTELPDISPVVTIRCKSHVRASIEHSLCDLEWRSVYEDVIMGLHDLAGSVCRGNNEGWDLTKVEEHEGTVYGGDSAEGAVGEGAELVEIAQDRNPRWTWRERSLELFRVC